MFGTRSQFLHEFIRIMTWLHFKLVPRVCGVDLLIELDVSALGFPLPFLGGLGVLCCLDDIPRGVLRVWSAAGLG